MPVPIYIIDDDESVCRALKTLLMTYDFEVTTFNSAQSFFDTVAHDDPGCLLLDIHMSGLDGWGSPEKDLSFRIKSACYFYFGGEKGRCHQSCFESRGRRFLAKTC